MWRRHRDFFSNGFSYGPSGSVRVSPRRVRAGRVGASDPWCLTILISTIDLHDTQANYVFVRKRVVCPLMHEDIVRAMQETIYLGQDNGKPAFHQIVDHKETNHV